MLFAVGNIASELAVKSHPVQVFTDDENAYVLFCLGDSGAVMHDGAPGIQSGAMSMQPSSLPVWTVMEGIRSSIARHLGFTVSIGIGTMTASLTGIHESFDGALRALDYRMIHGGNRILMIGDLESTEQAAPVFTDEDRHALLLALKIGEEGGVRDVMHRLLAPLAARPQIGLSAFQASLMSILAPMMQVAAESGVEANGLFPGGDGWMTPLLGGTLQEVSGWVTDAAVRLGACIAGSRRSQTEQIVTQAVQWVAGHYSDPELSIGSISQMVHVSASHFSALFRKETGESFLNHVTQVRLKAARELLAGTELKTADIAERVGYPDPHYFSYFFKKNMGVSPKEFRGGLKG